MPPPGDAQDLVHASIPEIEPLLAIVVAGEVEAEVCRQDAIRFHARIDALQLHQRARRERRADQQRHRDRHLPDDEQATQPPTLPPGAARAVFQVLASLPIPGKPRPRTKEQSAEERNCRGEKKHRRADPDLVRARQERRGVSGERIEPHFARPSPARPPSSASSRFSVMSCCRIRPRPAPSAIRIASSWSRRTRRESARLATFAQAIRRTNAEVASRTKSGVRDLPVNASAIPSMRSV